MDLSFRFDRDVAVSAIPVPLAVLLAGAAVRQSAGPTARLQARLDHAAPVDTLLAPAHGAFNLAMEGALTRWKGR